MKIEKEEIETLARLIKSTKTKQPLLDTFETGGLILEYLNRGVTINELAEKLSLDHETVRQFKKIGELDGEVKDILRKTERTTIFDIAYRITLLDNVRDQRKLAKLILKERLDSKTVREVIPLKKYNPEMDFDGILEKIRKSRPEKVDRLLIPCDDKNLELVASVKDENNVIEILRKAVRKTLIETGVKRKVKVEFAPPFLIIDLKEDENNTFLSYIRQAGATVPEFVNKHLEPILAKAVGG